MRFINLLQAQRYVLMLTQKILQVVVRADLFILDGEAAQQGGLGMARQLKDEVFNCPPILVITGRKEDKWLAAWSLAEASVVHPIDPFTLAKTAAQLLRGTAVISA